MMVYRELIIEEVEMSLFASFNRRQNVTKCWRKIDGEWRIKNISFIDDWSEDDYLQGIQYLKQLICSGGYAVGAFWEGKLKGFASVEPIPFGSRFKYLDLSNLHVSEDMRGKGVGRKLFEQAVQWAKLQNAQKLYISAHSSVESQAFYKAMGCVEAIEYNLSHVEAEPFDCQLEYAL